MKSPVIKRSIVIAGHKTSVSIEDAFWNALKEIAQARRRTSARHVRPRPASTFDIDQGAALLVL